jgi:hypothetical protein
MRWAGVPLRFAVLVLAFLLLAAPSKPEPSAVELDVGTSRQILEGMESTCGLSRVMAISLFEARAPRPARVRILSSLWDAAAGRPRADWARAGLLWYFAQHPELVWDEPLRLRIRQARSAASVELRRAALTVFLRHQPEQRGEILAALADPDDWVRDQALRAIAGWPDAKPILKQFIETNNKVPILRGTVELSRFLLNKTN